MLERPVALLEEYRKQLAPGSVMILSHGTGELMAPSVAAAVEQTYRAAGLNIVSRIRGQVAEFFDGWKLVEPGIVPVNRWRETDAEDRELPVEDAAGYAGVVVKR